MNSFQHKTSVKFNAINDDIYPLNNMMAEYQSPDTHMHIDNYMQFGPFKIDSNNKIKLFNIPVKQQFFYPIYFPLGSLAFTQLFVFINLTLVIPQAISHNASIHLIALWLAFIWLILLSSITVSLLNVTSNGRHFRAELKRRGIL